MPPGNRRGFVYVTIELEPNNTTHTPLDHLTRALPVSYLATWGSSVMTNGRYAHGHQRRWRGHKTRLCLADPGEVGTEHGWPPRGLTDQSRRYHATFCVTWSSGVVGVLVALVLAACSAAKPTQDATIPHPKRRVKSDDVV
jgi:hypothetical protein